MADHTTVRLVLMCSGRRPDGIEMTREALEDMVRRHREGGGARIPVNRYGGGRDVGFIRSLELVESAAIPGEVEVHALCDVETSVVDLAALSSRPSLSVLVGTDVHGPAPHRVTLIGGDRCG